MNKFAENLSNTLSDDVVSGQGEKRPINLVTCRATERERDRLKELVKKYGLAGPSHFFRTCLEKFFEADAADNLKLPIDLVRTQPESQKRRK